MSAGEGQRRRKLGQPRLIIIDPEDELHDGSHRRARLGFNARFLEQLGVFVRALIGGDREVVGQRQRAVERGAGAAFASLDRFSGLARGP